MKKSEIFIKAHASAKQTVRFVGDYRIAFSLALKSIYKELKESTRMVFWPAKGVLPKYYRETTIDSAKNDDDGFGCFEVIDELVAV